ncbi:MGMT family protein [Blastococcus sp. SYSU DS0533]
MVLSGGEAPASRRLGAAADSAALCPASVGMVDERPGGHPIDEGSEEAIMNGAAERVLATVSSIPSGRVMTYGSVAEAAGTGARAVGQILRNGGHHAPWWRVVDARGRPVVGVAHEALAQFLEASTPLLDRGDDVRVDLARASWSVHDAVSDT